MKDETSNDGRRRVKENAGEEEVSFFNKVRADVFKRKVEAVLKEGVLKNIVSDMKMPREIVTHLISQIDETKQATLKLVTKEVRLFLENTNLSDEMARLLSQLSFEVSTKIRFVRNDPPDEPQQKKRRKPLKYKAAAKTEDKTSAVSVDEKLEKEKPQASEET